MASAGSRTITAGSEFHRPRSTLNNANQYATTGIPATSQARAAGPLGTVAAASGQGVQGHGGEQDNRGPDVLASGAEANQDDAVVDDPPR